MNRFERWAAAGGEVAVAGLGRSGVAATRLLRAHGIVVYASDVSSRRDTDVAQLQQEFPYGVTAEAGGHDLDRIARSVALVVSPGIPPDAAPIRTAREAGVEVVAEAQLGLDELEGVPFIAVTGTNGKTTTTALVEQLLRAGDRRAMAAGNIGTPLCAAALESGRQEWLAVELSSFQLHDLPDLHPTVGVLTNLAPDHLDRYADLEEYYADKARLFANAGAGSIWVSNLDDPGSRAMVAGVAGRHLAFSTTVRADGWFDRERDHLMIGSQPLIARSEFHLLGDHNVANALAASLAVHATGVPLDAIARGLESFMALDHRMEPVATVREVLYLNDSKATNVASTRVALDAMDRPFVLMLGGRHKGEPYTALADGLAAAVAVVAYGESAPIIDQDLRDLVRLERADGFEEAVRLAASLAPAGGAVLLSPACSSYDQFDNYEQRGAAFRQIVRSL
jgi:UDP-N-acetylmuramoylalanine--D-glutamate ligase